MATNITIPVSDALAARLTEKYETLVNLRQETRQWWRMQVLEEDMAAFLKGITDAAFVALDAQKTAKRAELETLYT